MKPTIGLPNSILFVRHGESAYNALAAQKEREPLFQKLKIAYDRSPTSRRTRDLAMKVQEKLKAPWGDHDTPLTERGREQSEATGKMLSLDFPTPDIIFCSPYLRTRDTLGYLVRGWAKASDPAIKDVDVVFENLIREQNYGTGILYNDWRVFQALNPDQKRFRDLNTPYWYQYPQGESIADVVERVRAFHNDFLLACADKNVLVISHHRTILSYVALREKLKPDEVLALDEKERPINCGVTFFRNTGRTLLLKGYNESYWHHLVD
jgi:broad specificity phosphatase PhoE